MKLLTKALLKKFPMLYETDGGGDEVEVIAKFFKGGWTWYATEYDEATGEFFGLVDGHEAELGYFILAELEANRVERDLYFKEGFTVGDARKECIGRRHG